MMKRAEARTDILDVLDDDILLWILDKLQDPLDRKAWCLVCKQFYRLEAGCRKKLQLMREEMLPRLLERYRGVQHLDLSLCPYISDQCLQHVATVSGRCLRSINLSRLRRFTQAGLSQLGKGCRWLVEIDLSYCSRIGDEEMAAISEAHNLESLKLVKCQLITDLGLGWVAVGCSNLRILNLKLCLGVTDLGIELVAVKCKELRFLNVSYLQITNKCIASIAHLDYLENLALVGCVGVDDEGLAYLRNSCNSLQRLDVSKCRNVSCKGIISLASGCIALQQLTLAYCIPTTNALLASFQKFDSLQSIKFDGCEIHSTGLDSIGKNCKFLRELSLSKCIGVTDEGISAVVAGCRGLKNIDLTCCHNLTDVAISAIATSCRYLLCLKMESCILITERSLDLLGHGCPFLEELDLTDCSINNAGLKSISRFSMLTKLKLGLCPNISDEGITYIGAHCSNLEELDLYRSVGVGDVGLTAVANGCSKLRIINLSYCIGITDDALKSLARLDELCNLEIRGCFVVTSNGLSAIALGCKRLVELDIKRCYYIDDAGVLAVAHWCRNLRQINVSYCPISDVGLLALASLSCLQNMKMVHVRNVSLNAFVFALLASESLKKVKLLNCLKYLLPQHLLEYLEDRGCRIRWMDKPLVI